MIFKPPSSVRPLIKQTVPRIITSVRVNGDVGNMVVNPVTNRLFFLYGERNLGILDGSTNRILTTLRTGQLPFDMAVNTRTNRVYLSNFFDGTVSVISGRSNRILTSVKVGERCDSLAVNTRTNLIYVVTLALSTSKSHVVVLNGATNRILKRIPFTGRLAAIVVNERTNRIYVTNVGNNTVSVLDGSTNTTLTTVRVGNNPVITPVLSHRTNQLFIPNNLSRYCSVLNLATNRVSRIQLGRLQSSIILNPVTNRIYITSAQISSRGKLFLINAATNRVMNSLTIPTFTFPVINSSTNHLFLSEESDTGTPPLRVYNGTTLQRIASLPLGKTGGFLVLNPRTNRLYAGGGRSITVIQD